MIYSIEPKDRIYGKGYGFLSFAKNGSKYSQILVNNIFLTVQKNQKQMQYKLFLKGQSKKQQKQLVV